MANKNKEHPSIHNPELYAIANGAVDLKALAHHLNFSYPRLNKSEEAKRTILEKYYKEKFPQELEKLTYHHPNSVISKDPESFKIDQETKFFGGMNWENFDDDLGRIKENKSEFVFFLFTITMIDVIMFSHFQDQYQDYRKQTKYPKFGWVGFGPHYENPKMILLKSEQKNIIQARVIKENLKAYLLLIGILIEETGIDAEEFIRAILKDPDLKALPSESLGSYSLIYNELKNAMERPRDEKTTI
jgi:hypothetical protein